MSYVILSKRGEKMKFILMFKYLKENGAKFWKGQPFKPSTLNSDGIWSRVLEELKNKKKDIIIEEKFKEMGKGFFK